ncbi:PREDICTED: uncharacterized protein LOC104594843 isoform X2 [Nelumbo nucifera]|uniref:Uncharacterized protein LOC104594843 isoform X2 n=1 Tax=Nelumbo nucifera TaxID=4432 RepID=A0A1U8Q208_NELNU|nr:PREDICTED: uncharacterized protein LOC104594843 isoform X2 [Nelumbo nucifera]
MQVVGPAFFPDTWLSAMEAKVIFSSHLIGHRCKNQYPPRPWAWNRQEGSASICFKAIYYGCSGHEQHQKRTPVTGKLKLFITKPKKSSSMQLREESIEASDKKGTVLGAVSLIIGTSIGSGILALPKRTSPAGFVPSAVSIIVCWIFLLVEALLLAEINVGLMRRRREKGREQGDPGVISIRTMAQETLGEWGGTLATVSYIFLAYTSMVAYTSKSGEILYHLINLPTTISGIFFTSLFTILISIGGTQATDQVNQWLTSSMIGLLVAIEVLAVLSGGWSGLEASGNWGKVPSTIPVIIFSLVYHDLAPVICAYLDGDLTRIRVSFILGSLVPLFSLLIWDAIALGLSTKADGVLDPVDLLIRVEWSGISVMVEAFSLLAVGTSLIGTLLGFSQFFVEQLNNLSWHHPSTKIHKSEGNEMSSDLKDEIMPYSLRKWWSSNKLSFTATAMAVAPPLFVSSTVPDAFYTATDIAGGYCMTLLYGILPPAMAWVMRSSSCIGSRGEGSKQKILYHAKPALLGVGLFACVIILEQILQDFLVLNP